MVEITIWELLKIFGIEVFREGYPCKKQLLIVQLLRSFNIWRYPIVSEELRNDLGIFKEAFRVCKPDIWKQQQMAELSYKFESLHTHCFCFS